MGIFNNFQKFQVCSNIISAQISQKKNDRLKSANFGTLIYERTHIEEYIYVKVCVKVSVKLVKVITLCKSYNSSDCRMRVPKSSLREEY